MDFVQFVEWVSRELDQLSIDKLLDAVDDVLQDLPENDPRYAWLVAIEEKLLDDEVPRDRLRALAERFPPPAKGDPETLLENNLRSQIERLTPAECSSESLRELVESVQIHKSDPRPLQEFVRRMEEQLGEFWTEYHSYPLGSDEVPARVGERLLAEAYDLWQSAIMVLRDTPRLSDGLELATEANRILVVLQRMKS